ncbi:MAG TPA: hypothetical protein VJT54_10355 [Verrucomicrobiae bacterium]|nr:hypothetical protein [Verrucomicrobiae bacterium]
MRSHAKIRLNLLPQERGRLVRVEQGTELAGGPPALQSIPVEWHDCAWRPRVTKRFAKGPGHGWRVGVLDCGGKWSATPLSGWALNLRTTPDAFTRPAGSKAVSPPPHSRTAGAFHSSPRGRTLF